MIHEQSEATLLSQQIFLLWTVGENVDDENQDEAFYSIIHIKHYYTLLHINTH